MAGLNVLIHHKKWYICDLNAKMVESEPHPLTMIKEKSTQEKHLRSSEAELRHPHLLQVIPEAAK